MVLRGNPALYSLCIQWFSGLTQHYILSINHSSPGVTHYCIFSLHVYTMIPLGVTTLYILIRSVYHVPPNSSNIVQYMSSLYTNVPCGHPVLYFLSKFHGFSGSCNIIYSPHEPWFPGVMQHSSSL